MNKFFRINSDEADTRLDRWFKRNVINIPQSLLEKSIRKGMIKVNNEKKKSSYKLKNKDEVIIYKINFLPNKKKSNLTKYIPKKNDLNFSSNIFIENNLNFAVINKPHGIAVQSGTKSKKNLIDILAKTKEFFGSTPYTVHRLDKDTTGILLVAKNRQYAQLLTSLFRIRKIHKTYLAIVIGKLENKKGTLKNDLITYEGRKKLYTKAITHFAVIDTNKNFSLLKLNPETGRKHQIRKQLLMLGHPILGDNKYRISFKNFNKKELLMLHAFKINFSVANIKYNFLAKVPDSFQKILNEKHLKIH